MVVVKAMTFMWHVELLRQMYRMDTCRILEALNIEPGTFCQVLKDKIRKTRLSFKRRRANAHRQNCKQTARKEATEGKT